VDRQARLLFMIAPLSNEEARALSYSWATPGNGDFKGFTEILRAADGMLTSAGG
jgi:hypothetical protein